MTNTPAPAQFDQPGGTPFTASDLSTRTEATLGAMSDAEWSATMDLVQAGMVRNSPQLLLRLLRARAIRRCCGGDAWRTFEALIVERRLVLKEEGSN